jgi:methylglyoxal synthase
MKVKIYYAEVAPELEAPEFDLNSLKVRGDCTIGRSPECGLVLDGADLSRQHAKFSTKNGIYYFTDLGSRNGSLFNGELVGGGQEYSLNAGDTIRIGDFILKVEEEPELAATVFKVIDPELFKVDRSQVEAPANPAEAVTPALPIEAAIAPLIVSGIIINDPSAIVPPNTSVEQPPSLEPIEDIDISTPPAPVVAATPPATAIGDELSLVTPLDLAAEPASLDDLLDNADPLDRILAETPPIAVTSDDWGVENLPDLTAEPPSLDSLDDDLDSTDPLDRILAETPPTAVTGDDWGVENLPDLALAAPPSLDSLDDDLDNADPLDRILAEHPAATFDLEAPAVQPPSLLLVNEDLAEPEVAQPASAIVDSEDLADLDLSAQPEIALEIDRTDDENVLDRVSQEYPLPPLTNDAWNDGEDAPELPVAPSIVALSDDDLSLVDLTDRSQLSLDLDDSIDEQIPAISSLETDLELARDLESDLENTSELAALEQPPAILVADESVAAKTPDLDVDDRESTTDEPEAETPDLGLVNHELTTDEPEEIEIFDRDSSTDVESEASAELELEIPPNVDNLAPIAAAVATATVVGGFNAYNHGNGAELLSKKQIVLIAHDSKIADLTDIVERHKDFLAKCLTISWSSIADDVRQQTGLEINQQISSGASGGYQTIASLVNAGDVLAVIFLKDYFAPPQAGQANEEALLRLCNINEILLATNIATADSIVHYLQS